MTTPKAPWSGREVSERWASANYDPSAGPLPRLVEMIAAAIEQAERAAESLGREMRIYLEAAPHPTNPFMHSEDCPSHDSDDDCTRLPENSRRSPT